MDSLTRLNHAAQQHAKTLHSQLSQLLVTPAASPESPSVVAPAAELRQLTACNAQLAKVLASTAANSQPAAAAAEDAEELQAACYQRQQLLQDFISTLDDSVLSLRSQLDACHKLVRTPPCKEDPEAIIRYAFTLRHGFAPLGSAPGLIQVPPAPQLPFMLCSTLRVYEMDLAAQQQQAQQPGPLGAQQPLPGAMNMQLQQEQQPAAGAQLPAEAAEPAPAQPVTDTTPSWQLNTGMSDDEFDLGSEVAEEYSSSSEEDQEEE